MVNKMNPMKLMQIKGMVDRFKVNHPRIPGFFNAVANEVAEGSVIEMKMTSPEGKELFANIRVNAGDMELLKQINEFGQK